MVGNFCCAAARSWRMAGHASIWCTEQTYLKCSSDADEVLDASWRLYAVPERGGPESDTGASETVFRPDGKLPWPAVGESKEFLRLRLSILASSPLMRSRISTSVLSFLDHRLASLRYGYDEGAGGGLGLLCRLGNAIVAFETEFLASATFWTLFITPLLPAPACIASLGWSEDGHIWQMVRQGRRNRAHLGSNGTSLLSEVRSGGSQQGTGGRRGNRRGMCVTHHPHGTEVMRRGGTLREPEGEDELTLGALEAEAGEEAWTSGCELFARAGLGSEACPHPDRREGGGRIGVSWAAAAWIGPRPERSGLRAGAGGDRAGQLRRGGDAGRTESGGRRRSDGLGVLRVGAETGDGGRGTGWSCGIGEWSTWGPVVCTRRRRKR